MRSAANSLCERELPLDATGERLRAKLRARALFVSLTQILGSNALVGLAGLATLPILARNLGPATYGRFSLFVAILGVLSSLDFARPVLVRELAAGAPPDAGRRLERLSPTSALLLAPLSFAAGLALDGVLVGVALAAGASLYALASTPYARLAADGRVGAASAVRNVLWTAALGAVAFFTFDAPSFHAVVWPFVAANAAILVALGRLAAPAAGLSVAAPSLSVLREHASAARDVIGFGAAGAVVVAADRALLARAAPAAELGHYGAQYDLATKVNILSTALGTVLYPLLARLHRERGFEAAARTFVRLASWIALGYFVLLAALIVFQREVVLVVLGPDFERQAAVYGPLLVGVFLHLFGFLVAPWQRACGDFGTQRRAYGWAALLMVAVGLVAIPLWGARGAVLTYLVARTAELVLVASVVRSLPRAVLPRRRVALLAAMTLALAALAALCADGGAA